MILTERCSRLLKAMVRSYGVHIEISAMKIQRIAARILLIICVALPPLHSLAISPDDYLFSSNLGIASLTDDQQFNLHFRIHESRGTSDSRPAPEIGRA